MEKVARLSEVEFTMLEESVVRSLMTRASVARKLNELKELGDVSPVKAGLTVNVRISKDKLMSLFFARRYDSYVYRNELFYKVEEEEK